MEKRPLFSICHTTARPDGWQDSWAAWCDGAQNRGAVEYILCVERSFGFTPEMIHGSESGARAAYPNIDFRIVSNNGKPCSVSGWNTAAAAARGSILILNSDDMRPPVDWDIALELASWSNGYQPDFVIQVSSGSSADARDLMVLQILSRARYERLGYALYPGYESMYSDNDFAEHARHDGVVIDAKHITVQHLNPLGLREQVTAEELDAVYLHQNRQEAYQSGSRLFQKRLENGFTEVTAEQTKVIAACLPGEVFSMNYLIAWDELQNNLIGAGYGVAKYWGHSSNVYHTRNMLHNSVLQDSDKFSYVLWIDDDNIVTWENLRMLLEDLEQYPDISMVCGWCYIQPNLADFTEAPDPRTSVGMWVEKRTKCLGESELREATGLRTVDWTGFPVVLMRIETAKMAGFDAFLPRVGPEYNGGMTGEDISFCLKVTDAGGRIVVDPRVRVEHLKTRPIDIHREYSGGVPVDPRVRAEVCASSSIAHSSAVVVDPRVRVEHLKTRPD